MWLAWTLSSTSLWGAGSILTNVMMRKKNPAVQPGRLEPPHFLLAWTAAHLAVAIALISALGFGFPAHPWALLLIGLLHVCSVLCVFRAFEHAEAMTVGPLLQMGSVFTLIFSALFLGEGLAAHHFLAFLLLLSGAWLITAVPGAGLGVNSAFWLMIGSCFFAGLANTGVRSFSSTLSPLEVYSWSRFGCGAGFLLLCLSSPFRSAVLTIRGARNRDLALLGVGRVMDVAGALSFFAAMAAGPSAAIVSAATGSGIQAFIFLLGCGTELC